MGINRFKVSDADKQIIEGFWILFFELWLRISFSCLDLFSSYPKL